jgi:hypothetical protein
MSKLLVRGLLLIAILAFVPQGRMLGQERIRGFSYWEMCWQLRTSSETCEALDVSPEQRARLDHACSQLSKEEIFAKIGKRLFQQRQQLQQQQQPRTTKRNSQRDIFWEADKEVLAAIHPVLTPKQLEKIFPIMLHAKYPTGYAPFGDSKLFEAANISFSSVTSDDFQSHKKKAIDRHKRDVSIARLETAKKILESLSDSERQKFVNCAGNTALPSYTIDFADGEVVKLQRVYSIRPLLEFPELQKQFNISTAQLNKLRAISDTRASRTSELGKARQPGKTIPKMFEEILSDVNESATKVLTPTQKADYCRLQTWNLFLSEFSIPSELGLDNSRKAELRTISIAAQNEFFVRHAELDKQVFTSLCAELPSETAKALLKLFEGAFDMPIDPRVFWDADW